MPVLPSYDSSNNINTTLGPERDQAAQPFKDNAQVLGTLQDITQKLSDAHDAMQETSAKASYENTSAKIQAAQAADNGIQLDKNGNPSFVNNSGTYLVQMEDAKNNALNGIDNQELAGQLRAEMEHNNYLTGIKINSDFTMKQLNFNKSQVPLVLTADQNKILNAKTEAEKQQAILHSQTFLNNQVQNNVLTPEEAHKALGDAQETSVKFQVYNDPARQEEDSTLLKELKDPNGKYSYLKPETRLKMIEEDQKRIFQNNQTYKREDDAGKNDRFQGIFQKANEGTLSLQDLDVEEQASKDGVQGALKQKDILDIREGIQKRIKTDLEAIDKNSDDAEKYTKFVDDFVSDETDRQKGRELIVNAFKGGVVNPKEIAYLNQLKRETEGIQWDRQKQAMAGNNLIPFKNAIGAIGDFFTGTKNLTEQDHAMAIKQLLAKAADGGDPQQDSQQIIKDAVLKANPNILNLHPDGQLVIDDNGYLRIMNNKGEHKEAK